MNPIFTQAWYISIRNRITNTRQSYKQDVQSLIFDLVTNIAAVYHTSIAIYDGQTKSQDWTTLLWRYICECTLPIRAEERESVFQLIIPIDFHQLDEFVMDVPAGFVLTLHFKSIRIRNRVPFNNFRVLDNVL